MLSNWLSVVLSADCDVGHQSTQVVEDLEALIQLRLELKDFLL